MYAKLTFRIYYIKYAMIYVITYAQICSKTPYIIYAYHKYTI